MKIILVAGISRTGKTTSIKEYLNLEGVFHRHLERTNAGRIPARHREITIVFPLARKKLMIGVASAGDTLAILTRNFGFFSQHRLDVIVCASREHGSPTFLNVQSRATALGAQLIVIPKTKALLRNIQRANRQIARRILNAV